jgi:hypothetical protein
LRAFNLSFVGVFRGFRREKERNDFATTGTIVKGQHSLLVLVCLKTNLQSQLQ